MSVPRTQSLSRAITLLQTFERFPHGVTTARLARVTELAPATVTRLLTTLGDAGFVERGDAGWSIGPELVRVVARADPGRALVRRAGPVLDRLAAEGRESAMLAVPRAGPSIEILAQADGPRLLGLSNWVGRSISLHASAAGKLVLAELDDRDLQAWIKRERPRRLTPRTLTSRVALVAEIDQVRRQGWAILDEESEPGLGSIAVPVRDADNSLQAILGFSGPADRLDYDALLKLLSGATNALISSDRR